MPGRWSPETVRHLLPGLVSRDEMMDWTRVIVDDFFGDSIDGRWAVGLTGSGSAGLATDNPSRVLLTTGTTDPSTAELRETGFRHWSRDDQLTVRVRCRINATTTVVHRPILLDFDTSNRISIVYDTAAGDTGWELQTTNLGTTTTSATLLTADTDWNVFDLVLRLQSVRVRVNRGPIVENTVDIPTDDLEFRHLIGNRGAVSRIGELDVVQFWPGLAIF